MRKGGMQELPSTKHTILTSKRLKQHSQLNNFEAILADDLIIARKRDRLLSMEELDVDIVDLGVSKPIRKNPRLGRILSQRLSQSHFQA